MNQENHLLDSFTIKTSQDIYEKIASPLNALSVIADKLIIVSTIAVIVLLSLVVMVFLKDRRHEIGILYSMGENRFKIISQVILELLIIGLLSMTLAMFTGNQIGHAYSNYMIDNQREMSQYVVVDNISQDDVLDQYELAFNKDYIEKVYVTTTCVILFSALLPTVYILHLKPKKILL